MSIFRHRLLEQLRFHFQIFRQVADWTTWVYFLVPGALFAFYFYKETILAHSFGFLHYVPDIVFIFVLLYVCSEGTIRTFTKEADMLFFIHSKRYIVLKGYSFLYSMLVQVVIIVLLLLLTQPILQNLYGLTNDYVLVSSALALMLVHQILLLKVKKGWVRGLVKLLHITAYAALSFYVPLILLIISIIVILCSSLFYWKTYVQTNRYFSKQLEVEIVSFYRMQATVIQVGGSYYGLEKGAPPKKRKAYFANRTLHRDKITNLLLKTIGRDDNYRNGYIRLLSIQLPIYLFAPFTVDLIIYVTLFFIIKSWLTSVIVEILDAPLFKIIRLNDARRMEATKNIYMWLIYIPWLMIGIVVFVLNIL